MRKNDFRRETSETVISVIVNLDGVGDGVVKTPLQFFNHMLGSLATHSLVDMRIDAKGDLNHHIIEDTAIVLGSAIKGALANSKGISRFGFARVPMDCSVATCAIDIGGRPYSVVNLELNGEKVEDTAAEDLVHFFETFPIDKYNNLKTASSFGNELFDFITFLRDISYLHEH